MTLKLSDNLKLPDSIGTETIALLGRRGSGKSNTGTVIMEELYAAGQQFVLIDPKGEGWGLKAQGAGGPGLDVIVFGEPEGDLPLREEHGEMVADFVVTSGKSVVLSLAGLDADAASRRFVARFCERLYTLKKKPEHHTPLMVVLEEAHLFVPQRVEGAQADVVSRVQRLVRQGRSMGLGVMLIDQRPASVNKDVLTQIEAMVCHQLTSPHDRKAVDAWIEANAEPDQAAEFRKTLPTLQPGEAWFWSPAKLKLFERVTIRRRNTFDSGSTPILGKGASANRPKMRVVDLDKLRGQLEKVVEERKANDPTELKKAVAARDKEIVELKKAVDAKPAAPSKVKTIEKPVVTDKQIGRLERLLVHSDERFEIVGKKCGDLVSSLHGALKIERDEIERLLVVARSVRALGVPPPSSPADAVSAKAIAISPKLIPAKPLTGPAASGPAPASDGSIGKAQQKILDSLAWWEVIGDKSPPRGAAAVMAGYTVNGHFNNLCGSLRTAGLIDYPGDGSIQLTGSGRAGATYPDAPGSLKDVHAAWKSKLSSAQWKIVEVVIVNHPQAIERDELAPLTGYTVNGHFNNLLGSLRTLGVITPKTPVAATTLLFPKELS